MSHFAIIFEVRVFSELKTATIARAACLCSKRRDFQINLPFVDCLTANLQIIRNYTATRRWPAGLPRKSAPLTTQCQKPPSTSQSTPIE